jgi:hypothetical protein
MTADPAELLAARTLMQWLFGLVLAHTGLAVHRTPSLEPPVAATRKSGEVPV